MMREVDTAQEKGKTHEETEDKGTDVDVLLSFPSYRLGCDVQGTSHISQPHVEQAPSHTQAPEWRQHEECTARPR